VESYTHALAHIFLFYFNFYTLHILYLFLFYFALSSKFSADTTKRKQRLEPSDSQTLISMGILLSVINLVVVRFHKLEDHRRSDDYCLRTSMFFFIGRDKSSTSQSRSSPQDTCEYIALYSSVSEHLCDLILAPFSALFHSTGCSSPSFFHTCACTLFH